MNAIRLHEYHRSPTYEDVPEPQVAGPWDVVVDIGAAGVCRTDLHVIEGQWKPIQTAPAALHSGTRKRWLGLRCPTRPGRFCGEKLPDP